MFSARAHIQFEGADVKERPRLFELQQWPCVIREFSRVEDLRPGIMFAIERRASESAASFHGVVRIVEPKTEVIDLHWVGLDAGRCFGDECGRIAENVRRR